MTSPQQAKGDKAERELIAQLDDQGIKARRTRLAGRDDHGDLSGIADTTIQIKNFRDVARGMREGLAGARDQKARAGTLWAVAAIRLPGGHFVMCMDLEDWVSMHREATA